MFINQFRKEGIGEKAYIYCQRFIQQLKYRNRCHLTWRSYEHLWLVCYGHIIFCHKRHIMCTRLLHIRVSKNSWFFEKCSYSALWGDSCQLYFHISDRRFFYWKFPFLQLLISNNFSCNVHALILLVYQSLCWKWLQAQMLQCCCNSSVKSKKSLVSPVLADLQQILQRLTTEPGKWEALCCNIKWELPGDEGNHWPASESRVVPLGFWNSWEFIAIQTELSAKPWQFYSIENETSGGPMW